MSSVSVLVVEDFAPFQRFISSTLKKSPDLQVIAVVSDGLEAVQKAEELQPDLILLDIGLPTLNGIEAARQIGKAVPDCKILILTQESAPEIVEEAFAVGARGYVMKAHAQRDLLAAVNAVLQGELFLSRELRVAVKVDVPL